MLAIIESKLVASMARSYTQLMLTSRTADNRWFISGRFIFRCIRARATTRIKAIVLPRLRRTRLFAGHDVINLAGINGFVLH
jgi:hypothetical protein